MALKTKLRLGFGLCVALAVVMGLFGLWSANRLNAHTVSIASEGLPAVQAARGMQVSLVEMRLQEQVHILANDDDQRKAIEKRLGEAVGRFKKHREVLGDGKDESMRASLLAVDEALVKYLELSRNVLNLSNQGNATAAADRLANKSGPVLVAMMTQLAGLADLSVKAAEATLDTAADEYRRQLRLTTAMLIVLAAVAAVIGIAITRSVDRQIGGDPHYAFEVVSAIAAGDLTVPIRTAASDRSSLLFAMKGMAGSLANTVLAVQQAADGIKGAAGEVASGNLALSQRTEQQAGEVQQASQAMADVSGVASKNVERTRSANDIAASAAGTAVRGRDVVERIVATMGEISGSSRRISEIVAVIDGIAFQTNILALNAAVEAARAGDQGRSFAVVAAEVHTLAHRCATAAREIKSLIDESGAKVETGTRLVDEAGRTVGEIVAAVGRFSGVIDQIEGASRDQEAGLKNATERVQLIDHATRKNAAMVNQSAAAASDLETQAARLNEAVWAFKVDADGRSTVASERSN